MRLLTIRVLKSLTIMSGWSFLGDAVLDLIVGEYLFKKFPNSDEGTLSKIRASLVNEDGFAKLAREINLGDFLYLSSAEENNKGRAKTSLLSNAFEALMGAVYLEAGLEKARDIAISLIERKYPKIDLDSLCKDYKTALQEYTQAIYGITPTYKLLSAVGPDHDKVFEVSVILDDRTVAKLKVRVKRMHKKRQQKSL